MNGAGGLSGFAPARKVGAHVAPTVRAPAALSQRRRVQRLPLSGIVWHMEHRRATGWKCDTSTSRGPLRHLIERFVDYSGVGGQLGAVQRVVRKPSGTVAILTTEMQGMVHVTCSFRR